MRAPINSALRYVVPGICILALAGVGSSAGQPTLRDSEPPTRRGTETAASPTSTPIFLQDSGGLEAYTETIPETTVTFDMVPVPGGTVTVVDPTTDDGERVVEVAPFWIGKTEVTWDEYDVFQLGLDLEPTMRANLDAESRPSKPYGAPDWGFGHFGFATLSVTYQAVTKYAEWLSELTGKGYRLPTLAEWQHACRLGVGDAAIDDDYLETHVWYSYNTDRATELTASKEPDRLGLFDMLGNAGEWVSNPGGEPGLAGGTYREDAEELHCGVLAPQRSSWNATDPQFPKSSWWLSDGFFVSFRIARDGDR